MGKNEVLQIMGEPYMTVQGYKIDTSAFEILMFKVRVKYYPLTKDVVKRERTSLLEYGEVTSVKEVKPAEFADTSVWGEYYNLVCTFRNDKLVGWACPNLLRRLGDTLSVPNVGGQKYSPR
jgi:hypothetical protein